VRKHTKTHQRPFLSHLEASRRHALFPFAFSPSSINFAIASWRLRPFSLAHALISAALSALRQNACGLRPALTSCRMASERPMP
jgi:hypothetical protein